MIIKKSRNIGGLVNRMFAMILVILMVATVFGSSSFVSNTPEPMLTASEQPLTEFSARSTFIGMKSYTFDTIYGEPAMPSNLRIDSYKPDTDGLYIVQFDGPVHEQDVRALEDHGAEIYSYLPDYAYIVRMNSNRLGSVAKRDFVRWTGIYQPAYKIDPRITEGASYLTDGIIVVNVWNGPTLKLTMQTIDELSVVLYASYQPYFDHYTMKIEADASVIDDIARLPDVVWIEGWNEPSLLDETSSEIVGGIWAIDTPYGGPGNYANLQGWDGTGVIVSVADSGIGDGTVGDAGHVDFTGRVTGGTFYGTLSDWVDGHAHGTHVSGIVAGDGFGGTGTQYPSTTYYAGNGVAPDAQLYSQRIFS